MIRTIYIKKPILLFLTLLFTACASKQVAFEEKPSYLSYIFLSSESYDEYLLHSPKYLMYNNLEIDIYGRPQFQNPIYVRPTKIGSLFYIVEYRDSKISSYILVNVLMAEGEYENPFTNIYYTTSIGLVGGLETSKAILRGGGTSDPAANTILLVTAVSAPIIGPVGGFVYGIGDSSFDLVYDLQESYLMDYEEDLVSLTSLNYDVENRIISLNEYKKNDKKRKVQEFHYKKLNTNPCRIFERLSYEGDIFAESLVEENLLLEEDLCPTSKLKEP